ncbi:MAG: hypothetical protein ACE5GA_06475 [Candidatus Zixiibacteriota bacterium]
MTGNQQTEDQTRELLVGEDLAAPSQRESTAGRLFSALKDMSPTERRYQARRALVVFTGLIVVSLPFLAALWVKATIQQVGQSAAREISGSFDISFQITSEENLLPGGRPLLITWALPQLNEAGGNWVEVFRAPVDDVEALNAAYAEFISNEVAFIIYDTIYAVTTDGGHTWTTLGVYDSGGSGKTLRIDGVILDEYGEGLLFPDGVQSYDSAWVTDDYGLSWTAP